MEQEAVFFAAAAVIRYKVAVWDNAGVGGVKDHIFCGGVIIF